MAAQGQARLASSVHLVCRPRENPDGAVRTDEIGDWRDVLQELPACHPRDGERIKPGIIYVAPPDFHLMVDAGAVRLSHSSKEQHPRPPRVLERTRERPGAATVQAGLDALVSFREAMGNTQRERGREGRRVGL